MKELTIIEISEDMVRITCEGGRVMDTRNRKTYSEVECEKCDIKNFVASE